MCVRFLDIVNMEIVKHIYVIIVAKEKAKLAKKRRQGMIINLY